MVSNAQIAMMAAQAAFGILGPIILFLVLKHRYGMRTEAFIIGCVTMLVFAMVLESAVHRLVLGSSAGATIAGNTLYYALYGGLMAAIFEETGRYIAFHVFMKHLHDDNKNAIMYGAGHGGLEVFMIIGMTGISNLALAISINNGSLPGYTGDEAAILEQSVEVLKNTASSAYLLGMLERVSAVMLQIALSIIVWQTIRQVRGRIMYLFLALFIHFAVDFSTVILTSMIPLAAYEAILLAVSAVILRMSLRLYRSNR